MKKSVILFSLALAACTVSAKNLKVLMIGNSFSVCVLKQMPQVAADAGDTLDLASLMIGGCQLKRHWENVEKSGDATFKPYGFSWNYASEKDPKKGSLAKYGHKINLPEALKADKWDVVTIQQASGDSSFYETYQPYADQLIAKIHELAPTAEIVIQETWSYTPYDGRLAKWKLDPASMHAKLKQAYAMLAAKHGLRTIPTGDAIQLFREQLPVKYEKVYTRKEIAAMKEPEMPQFYGDLAGAARWGKGGSWQKDAAVYKLRVDGAHLNPSGEYMQALVWQAKLFGTDVTKIKYRPGFVTEETAAVMKRCAMAAVNAK